MKIRWNHRYVQLGVTAFLVIAASILFYYGIFHMKSLVSGIKTFFGIMAPIIYGAAIAYLLTPIVNFLERKIFFPIFRKRKKPLQKKGKKVILDTSGDLLKEGIKANPTMIKPNSEEMESLLGISINNKDEIIKSALKLHQSGIEVVVSLGDDGALLVSKEGIYQGRPPKIDVVNTVGCGDSMVAAFAVGFERGDSLVDSLKYAISVSAANALTNSTGSFKQEDAESIYKDIEITKINIEN